MKNNAEYIYSIWQDIIIINLIISWYPLLPTNNQINEEYLCLNAMYRLRITPVAPFTYMD